MIVSAPACAAACASAARSEPGPASFAVVTTMGAFGGMASNVTNWMVANPPVPVSPKT